MTRNSAKADVSSSHIGSAFGVPILVGVGIVLGALIVFQIFWALMFVGAVLVIVWTVASRPHPALLLLALPVSLVPPPLMTLTLGSRSMAVTLSDVVIAVALLAWAVRPVRVSRVWLQGNILLVVWTALSLLVSDDVGRSVVGLRIVTEAAVVAVIAATATTLTPSTMFRRLAWSAGLMSTAITAQIASQGGLDLLATGQDSSLAADIAEVHNSATQLTVSIGRGNYAAAVLLLGITAIICYWPFIKSTWERLVAALAIGIGAVGIFGIASKTQLITLAVVLLVAAIVGSMSRDHRGKQGRLLAVGILGILLVAGLAASWTYLGAVFAPLQRTGFSNVGTAGRRIEIWDSALATIKGSPLFGVGVFDLKLKSETIVFPTAHDTILQVAAETGLPGLLIYLKLFWAPIAHTRHQVRTAALVLISGLFAAGFAEPTLRTGPYDFVAWLLLGSVVALTTQEDPLDSAEALAVRPGVARLAPAHLSHQGSSRPTIDRPTTAVTNTTLR